MPKPLEEQRAYWREQRKIYRQRHPDRVKESKRKSNQKHKVKYRKRQRVWQENNRDKCRESCRKSYYKNRRKTLTRQKVYESKNRERINARRRARTAVNAHFRVKKNIQRKISLALKRNKANKSGRTMQLVGCDVDFLMGYLEARFTQGMTWGNYGKWEIDHRIPCSWFNLSNPIEQRRCFHYSNLQPMWGQDNRIKSAKLPGIHQAEFL